MGRPQAAWRVSEIAACAWLGVAALAYHSAQRSWESVVRYAPPFHFADSPAGEGPHVTHRVVLVVVDGLRLDRSRQLDFLNDLRIRGADFESVAGVPSYSRPGRASLATGASPEVHGVTSNRHTGTVGVDNLFRASRRVGGSVAVAGSDLWRSLFGPDLGDALVLESGIEEPRGAFDRVEPAMVNFERQAARRLAESGARLSILDLVAPDYAAHESGARASRYARACREADRTLGLLAAGLNLWTTTLIVTADHGHIDAGGHGGVEPQVLQIPLVLAGRGIRPGFAGTARQVDVAPTIAALLGLPIPGGSEGRPLVEAFDTNDQNRVLLTARTEEQRAAFRRQYIAGLGGDPALASADDGVEKARRARMAAEQGRRFPLALGALLLVLLLAAWVSRRSGWRGLAVAVASALGGEGLFRVLARAREIQLSVSVVNRDEDLWGYFLGILGVQACSVLCCVAIALLIGRHAMLSGGNRAVLGLVAATFAAMVPAVTVALCYAHQGLAMTWRIGDLGECFAAIVALARIQATGAVAAAVPLLAWLSQPKAMPPGPA